MFYTGASTVERYQQFGQKYTIGPDKDTCAAGPCWIWEELKYNVIDDDTVELLSPQSSYPDDFIVKISAGFHFCKVLSPARVTEWIYVDGLRAKYSLSS